MLQLSRYWNDAVLMRFWYNIIWYECITEPVDGSAAGLWTHTHTQTRIEYFTLLNWTYFAVCAEKHSDLNDPPWSSFYSYLSFITSRCSRTTATTAFGGFFFSIRIRIRILTPIMGLLIQTLLKKRAEMRKALTHWAMFYISISIYAQYISDNN